MSFIANANGRGYAPGFFLAEADCARETIQVSASHSQAVTIGANKIVPAGAVIPANGSPAKGILYEDVEVTKGDAPGSIVTRGKIYEDRLPAQLDSDAKTALSDITVLTSVPTVTRPGSWGKKSLSTITVASTDVAVSGYTLASGERLVYKIADKAVPVAVGEILSVGSSAGQWTAATFPLDELAATTGKVITVVAIDNTGAASAEGHTTIASKA